MQTKIDYYPSRQDNLKPSILKRRDPVVHPSVEESALGPLDSRQLASFEKDGFIVLDQWIDGDTMKLLISETERLLKGDIDDERVIAEPGGRKIRSIFDLHRSNGVVKQLCAYSNLAQIARQILGSELYIHQSRLNAKPGFEGKQFYWHSDFETWHVEDGMPRMRAVSCVVNLTHNSAYNGPLMIIPGSHKCFVQCAGETPENHYKQSLKQQDYGVPSEELLSRLVEQGGLSSMLGAIGTVVFFDCNAMHGSSGNISPFPRTNLFFVYNSVENALEEPFCSQKPRPDFIASRDFTPVSQY